MGLFNRKSKAAAADETRQFFPEQNYVGGPIFYTAEKNPTVSACVNKICNTLGILPLQLYVHTKSGKKLAVSNPLFKVLEHPSYEETPSLFYNTLIRHILLKGNAFLYISRNGNGDIVNFSIIDPDKCRVMRDTDYNKIFDIQGKIYTEREVLHIPYIGAGYNGTVGLSPVDAHRELIELDNNLLKYISVYFNNSIGTRYALESPEQTQGTKNAELDKLYAAIIPVINKYVAGASNAGKIMIPPPGYKLAKVEQTSNVQAQLDSLLNMIERQIAEAFNVPYEVISGENKYNNLETKQNDFLSSCIHPLGLHISQSFEKLLPKGDTTLFIAYEYKNLLTTNTEETINYLSKEIQSGLLSINEARSKLGMTDIGDAGDYYFLPAQLMPVTDETINAYMAKSKAIMDESEHNPAGDDKT